MPYAKRPIHRALNAIFGKIGRLASEEVTLELVKKMYAYPTLRTRMLHLAKGRYKIARFCHYTVFNETLQVNEY